MWREVISVVTIDDALEVLAKNAKKLGSFQAAPILSWKLSEVNARISIL